ncbi:MAG: 1,2-phenylacetyl-CoA epoxidase subunit PaaD [Bacteroidota bacterium]
MVKRTNMQTLDEQTIWQELGKITDPEIPVLSLVDMKIIRQVTIEEGNVSVTISPTFVGCPALEYIKGEIRSRLTDLGCSSVEVRTTFSPPWSTDMLDEAVREKLRLFGIAPPARHEHIEATLTIPAACPFCGSLRTRMESEFGATLCKQLFYCDACRQSFERFKTI